MIKAVGNFLVFDGEEQDEGPRFAVWDEISAVLWHGIGKSMVCLKSGHAFIAPEEPADVVSAVLAKRDAWGAP
jgi:hypothetical protein